MRKTNHTFTKLVAVNLLAGVVLGLLGCSQGLPPDKDNLTDDWERIASVPSVEGVYKVIDTEDSVICYYVISSRPYNRGPNGIDCLPAQL